MRDFRLSCTDGLELYVDGVADACRDGDAGQDGIAMYGKVWRVEGNVCSFTLRKPMPEGNELRLIEEYVAGQ